MKVLVTGGGGFIGSNLVDGLLKENHEVTVLDNFVTGRRTNLEHVANDIELVVGDICDPYLVRRLMKGVDTVFHLAALGSVPRSIANPWATHNTNVNGSLNILLGARDADVRRVILASSSSAYGDTPTLPKVETMPPTPLSPYAISKLTAELYALNFNRVYGMGTVVLRYFNVFGPRQSPTADYAAVIPKFIFSLIHREAPTINGDGSQTRDFTYVANVVRANLLAMNAPDEGTIGEVFNVGCGDRTTLMDVYRYLEEILGVHLEPNYAPTRAGDVRDSQASIDKARERLGYEPLFDIRAGLRETVKWFQSPLSGFTSTAR